MTTFGISFFKSDEVKSTSSSLGMPSAMPSFIKMVGDDALFPISDIYKPSEQAKNTSIGINTLNEFNEEFSNIESSTYLYVQIQYLKRQGASEQEIQKLELQLEEVDKRAEELYIRTQTTTGSPSQNLLLEKNIKNLNVANCGDRATLVQQKLNRQHIPNKKVMLQSIEPFAEHEFNVVGLDENADISDPSTWGDNAVIIDTWANKVFNVNSAKEFYLDFFGLKDFQNVQSVEDNF